MKKFFENLFNKKEEVDPKEDNSVLISAISLMIEVSLADEIMDDAEIETLKSVLLKEFSVSQSEIDGLISDAKANQNSSTSLYKLSHENSKQVLFWINPKICTCHTSPVIASFT